MRRLILAKAQRRKGAKWRHLILKDHQSRAKLTWSLRRPGRRLLHLFLKDHKSLLRGAFSLFQGVAKQNVATQKNGGCKRVATPVNGLLQSQFAVRSKSWPPTVSAGFQTHSLAVRCTRPTRDPDG